MTFNMNALVIFLGVCAAVGLAGMSNGGPWFHVAEAGASVVILASLAGVLIERRSTGRYQTSEAQRADLKGAAMTGGAGAISFSLGLPQLLTLVVVLVVAFGIWKIMR